MSRARATVALAASFVSMVFGWPVFAQTSPNQQAVAPVAASAKPAPVYVPTSLAVAPDVPRTKDGHPDLNGVVWAASYFAMLESVPMMLPPELTLSEEKGRQAFDKMMAMFLNNPMIKVALETDPEAAELLSNTAGLPVVRGERRTRLVVLPADGKLPFTPDARKEAAGQMARMSTMKSNNPEERMVSERCIYSGGQAPMAMMSSLHPRQFVQTRDHIVLQTEYGDETRIIPFTDRHGPSALGLTMGDAIARWDGDTLVIETTNFPASDRIRGGFPTGLLVNPDSKVIERYTRLSKDELLYQFTIEDPKLYTAPWLAEYSLFLAPYRMYPSSCHEGNYSLPNILRGQRVADGRAAKK